MKVFLALLVFITIPLTTLAHPGRTDSSGGHTCRTNCESWGYSTGEYHYHGGGGSTSTPSTPTTSPTPTPTPTPEPEPEIAETVAEPEIVEEEPVKFNELEEAEALVYRVIDGDTIKVRFEDDSEYTIRLIGIDTPETVHPQKPVQCFGRESSQQLKSLLDDKTVRLVKDSKGDTVDKYDRLLRHVYLEDEHINAKMIKEGYAYAYTSYPFDFTEEFKGFEQDAREAELGLWGQGVCDEDNEKEPEEVISISTDEQNNSADSSEAGGAAGGVLIGLAGVGALAYLKYKK